MKSRRAIQREEARLKSGHRKRLHDTNYSQRRRDAVYGAMVALDWAAKQNYVPASELFLLWPEESSQEDKGS